MGAWRQRSFVGARRSQRIVLAELANSQAHIASAGCGA